MNKLFCLGLLLCFSLAAASQAKYRTSSASKSNKTSQAGGTTTTTTTEATIAKTALQQTEQARSLSVEELEKGLYYPGFPRPRPQRRGGIVNRNYNSNSNSQYSSQHGQVYGSQQLSQRPYRPFYGKSTDEAEQDLVESDETEPTADAETVEDAEEKDGATEKGFYGYKPSRPRQSSSSITNTNTNINTNSITDYSSLFSSILSQLSGTQIQRPSRPNRPYPYYPYLYGKSEDVALEDADQINEESS